METPIQNPKPLNSLIATSYYSGFDLAHDTYNAISVASDGKIYYVLCSESYETGGQMYQYDPVKDNTKFIADLTDICDESTSKSIPQGKSHVRFYEFGGKLYFGTHLGVYEMIDGMERLPIQPPSGIKPYPGGHFISYDLTTGTFENLAIAPEGEGILTMTLDGTRGHIFALSWPHGHLLDCNLSTNEVKNLGLTCGKGEAGAVGLDYRVICRSMFVDSETGTLYFSNAEGDICYYKPGMSTFQTCNDINLRLDYFGSYDPTKPGSMSYNWRKIFWHEQEKVAYGIHGNSGYLFRLDIHTQEITILDRLTSIPSRKSGMFDQFSYGYLGFQLGPDKETIYYLTGGPIYENGKRVLGATEIAKGAAKGLENLHLITYHLNSGLYQDHGPIFYPDGSRPTYVNSIAIGLDGAVYTLARFMHNGKEIQDLIKIPNPFTTQLA